MSVNSATENIQDFSIRYPVILYNLFYGPSIVIPIEPVKLTRTYTAQCPICNQRTDTTDSNMREVYCINCMDILTKSIIKIQRWYRYI
jgi:hypothetical protein